MHGRGPTVQGYAGGDGVGDGGGGGGGAGGAGADGTPTKHQVMVA